MLDKLNVRLTMKYLKHTLFTTPLTFIISCFIIVHSWIYYYARQLRRTILPLNGHLFHWRITNIDAVTIPGITFRTHALIQIIETPPTFHPPSDLGPPPPLYWGYKRDDYNKEIMLFKRYLFEESVPYTCW